MKTVIKLNLTLFFLLLIFFSGHAQLQGPLPRHADLGATFSSPKEGAFGALVQDVKANSFAARLGLQKDDLLVEVNSQLINTASKWAEIRLSLKGGEKAHFAWIRNGKRIENEGLLTSMPLEQFEGVEVNYESVWSPYGYKVQTIVTKPQNSNQKMPGIFLVRWLSCSPVEEPVGRKGGTEYFLQQLIENSGALVMRVEKPGLGDSEGPPCRDVDFLEELAAHKAAFQAFTQLEEVDPDNIIILGLSNGGGYAPLVAGDFKPAGFAIMGGWMKTWYEHMLEIERRRFKLQGESPAEVSQRMKSVEEFYVEYLIRKKLPKDILTEKPHLQDAWEFDPAHQYGIPAAYFQQLQDLNLSDAWSKVEVPTLVMYGEYDWIMSRQDHEMIRDIVNHNSSGLAQFELLPGTDHSFHVFENPQQAFDDYWSGKYDSAIGEKFLNWFKNISRK